MLSRYLVGMWVPKHEVKGVQESSKPSGVKAIMEEGITNSCTTDDLSS